MSDANALRAPLWIGAVAPASHDECRVARAMVMAVALVLVLGDLRADNGGVGPSLPAFPGAEGFGAGTPGGRGGRVIEVTSLDRDGPGTLKEAVGAKGPRIVVFRIGGIIDLKRDLGIREPFITIAGQTAPGDGICLRGGGIHVNTHDVVIRYVRVRTGDSPWGANPENRDALDIAGDGERVYNVVIDHCSFSWALDENVTTWYGPHDVTIQWCISSESLMDSLHPKGPHGMGMLLGSRDNTVSVHHCLLAHNNGRNPLLGDTGKNKGPSTFDYGKNVMYNHGPWSCTNVRGTSRVNYIGNTIKVGPDGMEDRLRGVNFDSNAKQLFFVSDNVWPGRREDETDDWLIMGNVLGPKRSAPPARLCSDRPIPAPRVTTTSAANAYESVLRSAGAILPVRDVVDARIVEEVRTGAGAIIDTQWDVGGWPEYRSDTPPPDGDRDGMPDQWERRHGLDPQDPTDGPKDLDGDGYTNVEEYLNATNPNQKTEGAAGPQTPVLLQQGNERLRFGVARTTGEAVAYNLRDRRAFVDKVKASGREVADYLRLEMVTIQPGEFTMGKLKVVLTRPFEIAAHEVTQAQWHAVMGAKPWVGQEFAQNGDDNAATYVSWHDCQEFVARLSDCGERRYRLPTYAEWELACRAGSPQGSLWWFSEKELGQYAWYYDNTVRANERFAHPVGRKKASPAGLFDMAGNVHEWCHDYYEYNYFRRLPRASGPPRIDPMGPEPGSYYKHFRMLRGGSFYYRASAILQSRARHSHHRPGYRIFDVGFRVVRITPSSTDPQPPSDAGRPDTAQERKPAVRQ